MREIVTAVNCFADDNRGRYPPSVATIGAGDHWNWQEPTYLTAYLQTKHKPCTGPSARYLHDYITRRRRPWSVRAPRWKYKYLQEAWDAGDDLDQPGHRRRCPSPMVGTYCLYWNYTGYLGEERGLFRGPSGPARSVPGEAGSS